MQVTNDAGNPDWFQKSVCGHSGKVNYRVQDACGNVATTAVDYDVYDDTPTCPACKTGTTITKAHFMLITNASVTADASTLVQFAPVKLNCGEINSKWACQNNKNTRCRFAEKNQQCIDGGATYTTLEMKPNERIEVTLGKSDAGVDFIIDGERMFAWTACENSITIPTFYTARKTKVVKTFTINDRIQHTKKTASTNPGHVRVVGFSRSDGTDDATCADTPPCDANVCHGVNACTGGLGSLDSIRVMYLGWNPPIGVKTYAGQEEYVKVSEPGPQGQSPMKMYLHKHQRKMTQTDMSQIEIGQEFTVSSFDLNDGLGRRLPDTLNIRLDAKTHIVAFRLTCNPSNPIVVGDRFGSILVTGYTAAKKRQCHLQHSIGSFLTDVQQPSDETKTAANQAGRGELEADSAGIVTEDSGHAILAGGIVFVLVATLIALVIIKGRLQKQGTGDFSDTGSHFSKFTSKFSDATDTTDASQVTSLNADRRQPSAMDLINNHYGGDGDEWDEEGTQAYFNHDDGADTTVQDDQFSVYVDGAPKISGGVRLAAAHVSSGTDTDAHATLVAETLLWDNTIEEQELSPAAVTSTTIIV